MLIPVHVATVNDNFNSPGTNVPRVAPLVDLLFGQEGKAEDYRSLLSREDYGVFQNTSSDAKAGSFIVWQRHHDLGPGRQALMYAASGEDLLTRYLAAKHFAIRPEGGGRLKADLVAIAGHRPPQRDANLWPEWDGNFIERANRAKAHRRHRLSGCDWNQASPDHLLRETGLIWHSVGPRRIDGFAACPCIEFRDLTLLPKWTSDHQPVTGVAMIPTGPCKR